MKVKIKNRSVYHKFTEVEIEIDKDDLEHFKIENGKYTTIQDYLLENEDLYSDKIDEAMSKAEYVHGTGLYDFKGMEDAEADCEWRYETEKEGGHL